MKLKSLLLFCLFITATSYGQSLLENIETRIGEEVKSYAGPQKMYIFQDEKEGLLMFKKPPNGLAYLGKPIDIMKYNSSLEVIKQETVRLKEMKGKMGATLDLQEEIHFFNIDFIKSKGLVRFFTTVFSKSNLNFGDQKLLLETSFTSGLKRGIDSYQIKISEDNSKILIVLQHHDSSELEIHVYDSSLNEIWTKKKTFKADKAFMQIMDCGINNHGKTFFVCSYEDSSKGDQLYRVISTMDQGQTFSTFPLGKKGFFFPYLNVRDFNNQSILCIGMMIDHRPKQRSVYAEIAYSKNRMYSYPCQSSFFLQLPYGATTAESKSSDDFELEFLLKNESSKHLKKINRDTKKNKGKVSAQLKLHESIVVEDGIVLVAEEIYRYPNKNGVAFTHLEDIHFVKYNFNGDIIWKNKLVKKQPHNTSYSQAQFQIVNHKDNLYVIYNDHKDNVNVTDGEQLNKRPWRGALVLAEVLQDGSINKKNVVLHDEAKIVPYTDSMLKLDKEVYFYCRGWKLLEVKFE